ncbi:MAG TPA: nucleoside-diphosphate sugar epimerase/dehydratase [Acidimicrobiia bacterium]|nr:nucleoside-diphosphate sugar epimerase/dehydratase [Acidimicrobiia bacterium]
MTRRQRMGGVASEDNWHDRTEPGESGPAATASSDTRHVIVENRTDRAVGSLFARPVGARRLLRFAADAFVWVFALYAAVILRLDFDISRLSGFEVALLIPIAWVAQGGFGYWCGLYRGWWVLGSFEEVAALTRVAVLTTVTLGVVDLAVGSDRPAPLSSVIGAGVIAFVAMGGVRYMVRQAIEHRRRSLVPERAPAIVFGAGEGGERALRSMLFESGSPYVPVALLDDDPAKRNLTVRGVRVVGDRSSIASVATRTGASAFVIAIPTGDGALVREISETARESGLDVRVVPSLQELLGGHLKVGDLRAPTEVDLLGRHTIETDLHSVSEYLQGKRVVVTGAGGSIGSELCRQILAFDPAELVMIDRDESGLHGVQLSIEGRALLDSHNLLLVDIRDRARVAAIFQEIQPDVVFHAAALKHLPLLENHPAEALKTNIWGTVSVLEAAALAGVERFVNISTDKAANPSSALGYSKRIAEALTAHYGRTEPGTYLSVRFGNVLGSRGSVLTAFRAQLDAGQPLTVTHPDVTRYFMTVEEAVQLVVQAGAIGADGQALVLDMGEPVRIADVARQLAASRTPEVPVEFTGLRPGEKLHEVLFCPAEAPQASSHPLIRHVAVPELAPDLVRRLDPTLSTEAMRAVLRRLAAQIDALLPGATLDLVAEESLDTQSIAG